MIEDNRESEPASFGYRSVAAADKAPLVRQVFDSVAGRYDLMNDLMSFGVHRLWKAALVDWLRPRPGQRIVDVAGGTGDVAERILRQTEGQASVVVCDINNHMVEAGRDRALDRGIVDGIGWTVGDAEQLPFADGAVDAYVIAFGIRNVTHIERTLAEARRVLCPGGRFLVLEFSRMALAGLAPLYDFYSLNVLPEIGARVAGDAEAYRYLVESIRRFPDQERFANLIADAGLDQVRYRNLSGGIAAMHSAWRL